MKGIRPPDARRRRAPIGRGLVAGLAAALLVLLFAGFAARVAALRAHRATGPSWTFPSAIYSDAVVFAPGRVLPHEYLIAQLSARGYRAVPRFAGAPGTFARTAEGFEIGLRGAPDVPDPRGSGGPERVRLRIAQGHLAAVERLGGLAAMPPDADHAPRLEPALVAFLFDEDRVWRSRVSLERVPEPVRDAILASEDRRFRSHLGVDVRATARALVSNLRSRGVREGGSTVTQQLARGLFLGKERTLTRKLAELPLAVGLELLLSKEQILEMYLSSTYWGQAQSFGIGGIQQAARWYFDAPVESLNVLQGALLAAMIPAPNAIDPFAHPEVALEKRNDVLDDLVETGKLREDQARALSRMPLGVRRGPLPTERFPSYSGYVRHVLEREPGRRGRARQGLTVFTAMDLAWQVQAERAVVAGIRALDGGARRRSRLEGALVALEPTTAAVLAMVGGRDVGAGDFNRAFQARRQTGSAIKPIVYATALSTLNGLTPASTLADTQRTYGRGRHAWRPRNYDGTYHAEVTLAKALEKSLNLATTSLVEQVGPQTVARTAAEFGLGELKPVLSIGLGSNETTLLDLTNAFAVFADRGMLHAPSPIRAVVDHTGEVVLAPSEAGTQVIPEPVAALMTGLLENVVRYGVGYPLRATYGFERPVAGKTGTTDDYKDAWFVGFTPHVVAGVWVGHDRPRSIGRPAAHTALPIWGRAVGAMLAGYPPAPFPNETRLEWVDIDPWTGFLPDTMCVREQVPFLLGTAPSALCHHGFAFGYELENYDSLYRDSAWFDPYDTIGVAADTLLHRDEFPEPDPEPEPEPADEPDPGAPPGEGDDPPPEPDDDPEDVG